MSLKSFSLDLENLKKAALYPSIAAIVIALCGILGINFGSFQGLILMAIWIAAGILYTHHLLKTVGKPNLINTALHGALLAGSICLAYELITWVAYSIKMSNWSINLGGIILYVIQSAIIGLLAAVAWIAYRTDKEYV